MNSSSRSRGITLIELVIAVAILGVVAMMSKVMLDMMHGFAKQKGTMEAQRQTQLTLYQITKDLRNARAIQEIDSTPTANHRLVLNVHPSYLGYDTNLNAALFNGVGTVTYQYVDANGKRCIRRTADYPDNRYDSTAEYMVNIVEPPTAAEPIFSPGPRGGEVAPFNAAVVHLRPALGFDRGRHDPAADARRHYKTEVVKRGLLQ